MSTPVDSLELPALPETVAAARKWLRARLQGWTDDGLEAAQLVISELVTNVVLHGKGPVQVMLGRRGTAALLEVFDRSRAAPVVTRYGQSATTGRGLVLVDGIAQGWGVRRFPNGKGVWALLSEETAVASVPAKAGASGSERGAAPPDWPPPADLETPQPAAPQPARNDAELVTVCIVDLPLAVYQVAQQHNDALMREFHWLVERGENEGVPARLVALATEARARFAPQTDALRVQVNRAVAEGSALLSIELEVPGGAWQLIARLASLLDEADEYCEHGDLLTLASPPGLRRFRAWYRDQVLGQLEGRPPTAWPAEWEVEADVFVAGSEEQA